MEKIIYLYIVMDTIFKSIDQGNIYIKQKIAKQINKDDSISNNIYEGFATVNSINNDRNTSNNLNQADKVNVTNNVRNFNTNITQYRNNYKDLNKQTQSYINNEISNPSANKNYNVFINKDLNQSQIIDKNHMGCVDIAAVNNLTEDPAFKTAYPTNFTTYDAAKDACKLWAADTGNTVFAINKDISGNYKCFTGATLQNTLTQHTRPKTLYTVLAGTNNSMLGGLFATGHLGVWAGNAVNSRWNIPNMKAATLIKKFNSNNYSDGPSGHGAAVNDGWWGAPGVGGWGVNKFPKKIAWWISIDNFWLVGEMGYFYYVYNSPIAKTIKIYMVIDDTGELNINGVNSTIVPAASTGYGERTYTATLLAGKNVICFKLINGGGPGAFVLYGYDETKPTAQQVLFMSGPGWGYSSIIPPNYNAIVNVVVDNNNPTAIKTLNPVPAGYTNCHPVDGGGINKSSLSASFGRNCSNVTIPPLNIRYIRVTPNDNGDYIQIISIKVNAFVNGVLTNVATRGTATAANVWPGHNASDAITEGGFYHSATAVPGNWWQLDLGQEYPVTEIEYKNRTDCCQDRQIGMKITLIADSGTTYGPIKLTAAIKQNFNVSDKGLTATSPNNVGAYEYTRAQATAVCAARGARLCSKAELNNSDFCSCGWASDSDTPGYPMAHGDPTGKGWCGGDNGGKVWRDCGGGEWLNADGTLFGFPGSKKPDGNRYASAHCCK